MSAMMHFPALAFATSVNVMRVECPRYAWQVGEGGFGSVFQASGFRGKQAVAIKRGRRVDLTFELRDLKREVKLLQGCACMQRRSDINPVTQPRCRAEKLTGASYSATPLLKRRCDHPHLLPLLGHCLDKEAPCLIFPLMRGGSLQCRLQPTAEDLRHLQRLGFATAPKPLTWRQRIRVLQQARSCIMFRAPSACACAFTHVAPQRATGIRLLRATGNRRLGLLARRAGWQAEHCALRLQAS